MTIANMMHYISVNSVNVLAYVSKKIEYSCLPKHKRKSFVIYNKVSLSIT